MTMTLQASSADQLLDYLSRHTATVGLARELDDVVRTRRRLQVLDRRRRLRD